MLGVSRASAGEMLKRLEADGPDRARRAQGGAADARPAAQRAERVVRKHRIIERLLTDFMGYTGYEAHERADELGDTFSDEMIERIDEKLGHPERCPHGWPVDPDVEQEENESLQPLAALEPGARATIVRLAEHDGELLHWFYDQGLVPGQEIELRVGRAGRRPVHGRRSTAASARSREKAAAGLFVKLAASATARAARARPPRRRRDPPRSAPRATRRARPCRRRARPRGS